MDRSTWAREGAEQGEQRRCFPPCAAPWLLHGTACSAARAGEDTKHVADGVGRRHGGVKANGEEKERGDGGPCALPCSWCSVPPLRSSTAPWGCPGKCFSVKTMPVEEEHGHFLFRAVGDSHTVGKREARSSCSVVLLCAHPWLSLASPLPSSLRCGTIGLSCHVPTALRTDGPFPRTTVQRHKGAERGELRPCLRLVGCLFAGAQRCVHTTRGRGWWSTSRRQR